MKERFVTLAGALVALAIIVMLMWSPTPGEEKKISHPTSEDEGRQGLAALRKWLDASHVPTHSLRERYQALARDPALPERGNLLITVIPHLTALRGGEEEALIAWLSQGNSLLVLAARSDSPPWTMQVEAQGISDFLAILGFDLYADDETEKPSKGKQPPGKKVEKPPLIFSGGPHPLTQGLKQVVVPASDENVRPWELGGSDVARRSLALIFIEPKHSPVFWQARVGDSTVWISAYSDLFGNAILGEGDNARLMERLVNRALAPEGRVIFDDMHQGLTNLYDAQAFFTDERLLHTLLFLLALWIVYLLGYTNRFVPARAKERTLDLASDTRAAGGLFARHVEDHAVARRLLHHFHQEIRAMHHQPLDGEPAWDLLARNARIDPRWIAELQREQRRAEARRRINLVRLTHLMTDVREALQ